MLRTNREQPETAQKVICQNRLNITLSFTILSWRFQRRFCGSGSWGKASRVSNTERCSWALSEESQTSSDPASPPLEHEFYCEIIDRLTELRKKSRESLFAKFLRIVERFRHLRRQGIEGDRESRLRLNIASCTSMRTSERSSELGDKSYMMYKLMSIEARFRRRFPKRRRRGAAAALRPPARLSFSARRAVCLLCGRAS